MTYFGAASPVTFWNSDLNRVTDDFKEIRTDGFNSVILVVPWGEFQPSLQPERLNADAFDRLAKVCKAANAQQLQVYMRVSYLHDHYPDEQFAGDKRAVMLLSNDRLMPSWVRYMQQIQSATKGCANGSFLSWEDFWIVFKHIEDAEVGFRERAISKEYGYDAWVRRHADQAYRNRHSTDFKKLGYYPFPKRRDPDFAWVFRWFDEQLSKRLVSHASKALKPMSLEPRVDDDPIFEGDKRIGWYSHKNTYQVLTSPYVMSYWAPAMGASNHGELEPSNRVLDRFAYMQKKMAEGTVNQIFIEQFLFKDNSLLATQNARIEPTQVSAFLQQVAGPMLSLSTGYALWGARDYDASMVFNGFFSLGAKGWQMKGGAEVRRAPNAVALPSGSSISQNIREALNLRAWTKTVTLRLRLTGPGKLSAQYNSQVRDADVGSGSSWVKLTFPVASVDTDLVISSKAGNLVISEVHLYDFTQIGDVRDVMGQPGPHLIDIQNLNKKLDDASELPTKLSASDEKSFKFVAGIYPVEKDGLNAYAWAGPLVRAKIHAKNRWIRVSGFINFDMFKGRPNCKISAKIDGHLVAVKTYRESSPIDLHLSVPTNTVGGPAELLLSSSCSVNPKRSGKGEDDRNLAFTLREIDAGLTLKNQ